MTDVIEVFAGAIAGEVSKRIATAEALPDRLMSRKETAAYLGISTRQLSTAVSTGAIPQPTYYGPRSPRWSLSELQEWHKSHKK